MNPLSLYPIVILVALISAGGFYKYGYRNGWGDRDIEMQAQIAAKNEEARAKEQSMAKAITDKDAELRKANDAVNKKQADLNAAIRAGRVRLPSPSCVQAAPSPTPASGDRTEARSEPSGQTDEAASAERETLRLIAEIAAEGDRAINQLNACVDAYDKMRNIVNGTP